jgi:hypothetical protein
MARPGASTSLPRRQELAADLAKLQEFERRTLVGGPARQLVGTSAIATAMTERRSRSPANEKADGPNRLP